MDWKLKESTYTYMVREQKTNKHISIWDLINYKNVRKNIRKKMVYMLHQVLNQL